MLVDRVELPDLVGGQRQGFFRGLSRLADDRSDELELAPAFLALRAGVADEAGEDFEVLAHLAQVSPESLDRFLNSARVVCRVAGERLDLGGDDGESAPLLAGSRRFNRRVEGEHVGLRGDRRHPRGHLLYFEKPLGEPLERGGDRLSHVLAALDLVYELAETAELVTRAQNRFMIAAGEVLDGFGVEGDLAR